MRDEKNLYSFVDEVVLKSFLAKIDGLVKNPTSALCCISQSFNVRKVRLMITKFPRLGFDPPAADYETV
jgi:hypothetical protein